MNKSAKIRELLAKDVSVADIAKQLKIKPNRVYTVKWLMKKTGKVNTPKVDTPKLPKLQDVRIEIDHPEHYTHGGIETWDFIDAKELSYHLASVVKYVSRAGKKQSSTELKDLMKARNHLDRRIHQLVDEYKV